MKERMRNKQVRIDNNVYYWQFEDTNIAKIPKIKERKVICREAHEKELHRSTKYVYIKLKEMYYWPSSKKTIENVIKECASRQIKNRKLKQYPQYITSSRQLK